jgi:hypothetical protein
MLSTITIRNREEGETLPPELMGSLDLFPIDYNWQWVAEYEGEIVGQVLAANVHGILFLFRITAIPSAPKSWVMLAYRRILAEAKERGCMGFMLFLDDCNKQEVKLMRIVQKHGGMLLPSYGAWAFGTTETGY